MDGNNLGGPSIPGSKYPNLFISSDGRVHINSLDGLDANALAESNKGLPDCQRGGPLVNGLQPPQPSGKR